MYYCVYVYIGVTCVLLLGAVVLVVLVMSVVDFLCCVNRINKVNV